MSKIEFVPFEEGHAAQMGLIGDPAMQAWREFNLERSEGWTMLVDGEPVGAAGLCRFWPGVAEAWQITREGWEKYYIRALWQIRKRLPEVMRQMGLRRVQATCRATPQDWKWLQFCGFPIFEGEMEKYGLQGETCLRLSRVN